MKPSNTLGENLNSLKPLPKWDFNSGNCNSENHEIETEPLHSHRENKPYSLFSEDNEDTLSFKGTTRTIRKVSSIKLIIHINLSFMLKEY